MAKILQPYPFNERGNVKMVMSWDDNGIIKAFKNLAAGHKLTRSEKDSVFHNLQSNSGRHNYMLMGVIIPFKQFMKRYFVVYGEGHIKEIYAFDKTCIRSSFYTKHDIIEIIEVTKT